MSNELSRKNKELLKQYRDTLGLMVNVASQSQVKSKGIEAAQQLKTDLTNIVQEILGHVKRGLLCDQPIVDDEEIVSNIDNLTADLLESKLRPGLHQLEDIDEEIFE